MLQSFSPQPPRMISAGSGEARRLYIGIRRGNGTGGMVNAHCSFNQSCTSVWAITCLAKQIFPQKFTKVSTAWSMYTTDRSTVVYTEHGFSVMVLLIQGAEGLFYSLRKDNDNLCNTLFCNMHVWLDSIFFPFHWFLQWKKPHALARKIGQLKSSICFSFWKCSHLIVHEGTERIAFILRTHMTKGAFWAVLV